MDRVLRVSNRLWTFGTSVVCTLGLDWYYITGVGMMAAIHSVVTTAHCVHVKQEVKKNLWRKWIVQYIEKHCADYDIQPVLCWACPLEAPYTVHLTHVFPVALPAPTGHWQYCVCVPSLKGFVGVDCVHFEKMYTMLFLFLDTKIWPKIPGSFNLGQFTRKFVRLAYLQRINTIKFPVLS